MTTTFVLGAGASHPYSFPTAAGLKKLICENPPFYLASPWADDRLHKDFARNTAREIAMKFGGSGQTSIDAWLGQRKEFADWGKYAIANFLTPLEVGIRPEAIDDWYGWFFRRYQKPGGLNAAKVRLINFNYDRSFEHAMIRMCMNSFNLGLEAAVAEVQKIPMVHVYGALAWPDLRTLVSTPTKPTSNAIAAAAKGIRTMADERVAEHPDVQLARKWVLEAEHIVFLGFGFDPDNLHRIGSLLSNPDWKNTHCVATGVGLLRGERRAAEARVGTALSFGEEQEFCYPFVRNHVTWEP